MKDNFRCFFFCLVNDVSDSIPEVTMDLDIFHGFSFYCSSNFVKYIFFFVIVCEVFFESQAIRLIALNQFSDNHILSLRHLI